MDEKMLQERALSGDREALRELLSGVEEMVFNLSLRMLGSFADAEDAAQDILVKVMTNLAAFRGESAFSTWVFRVAVNYLKDYKKHMFAARPLSFEFYAQDIEHGELREPVDRTQEVERSLLAEELKLSCTNVMLQCLDPESRCIFVLGTMFQLDSRTGGELFGITPEAYRQRLCRARKEMADFLSAYCGEYGGGRCRCRARIDYAIENHRLDPGRLEYTAAHEVERRAVGEVKEAMEEADGLAQQFAFCKAYQPPERLRQFVEEFLKSETAAVIRGE